MNKIETWRRRTLAAIAVTAVNINSAYATNSSFETPAKNLIELLLTLIRYGGIILIIWGAVQLFLGINNHDATQKMSGVWMIFGGIALAVLKSILNGIGITW